MWDIPSRRCEKVLEDHSRPVLSLAISNNRLYSGSYDYNIKVSSIVVDLTYASADSQHSASQPERQTGN